MKCHKCGFVSFDHLSDCRKCGVNLEGSRTLLGMLDFRPTMPFFLGAMVGARSGGVNGRASAAGVGASDSTGLADVGFRGDLEIEIEADVHAVSSPREAHADQDLFPHIDLPEGFSLSIGDEEKGDDFELIIGPEFEQALARELDASDLESRGEPAEIKDELADLQFDEPILEPPVAAAVAEAAELKGGPSIPDLSLDIALDLEPLDEKPASMMAVPDMLAPEPEGADMGEGGLMIDFSQNDLNSLLLELEDKPSEA
ncbi:MAG: hypothetical protein MUC41_10310 [Syntrophobacteraceae bacterium]|jgi:hypothetical protein|nr:hypothetical protein [Syntrophobacteraceae bacterium]